VNVGQLLDGSTQLFSVAAGGNGYWADGTRLMVSSLSPPGLDRVPLATFENATEVRALCEGGDGLVLAIDAGEIGRRGFSAPQDQLGVRLARDQPAPRSVASDGVRAYWSTGDCQILSSPL
jgi:hypothetical protein